MLRGKGIAPENERDTLLPVTISATVYASDVGMFDVKTMVRMNPPRDGPLRVTA